MIEFIDNYFKGKELRFDPLPWQHQVELFALMLVFAFALIWDNHPTFRYLIRLFLGAIFSFIAVFFSEIWKSIKNFFGTGL